MDLGATEWQAFWHVTLPALAPGIVAAALLALTVSFDDYVITSMVAGVDSETLPMVIYAMARRGASPVINAISALIMVVFGALILISERVRESMNRRAFPRGGSRPVWPAARATARPRLNVYNWSAYVAPDTIPNFEAEFGVRVRYATYESNEEMLAKVLTGNSGWDVVFPTHNRLAPMRAVRPARAAATTSWLPGPDASRARASERPPGTRELAVGRALHVERHRHRLQPRRRSPRPRAGPICGARASKAASPCWTIPRTCWARA